MTFIEPTSPIEMARTKISLHSLAIQIYQRFCLYMCIWSNFIAFKTSANLLLCVEFVLFHLFYYFFCFSIKFVVSTTLQWEKKNKRRLKKRKLKCHSFGKLWYAYCCCYNAIRFHKVSVLSNEHWEFIARRMAIWDCSSYFQVNGLKNRIWT